MIQPLRQSAQAASTARPARIRLTEAPARPCNRSVLHAPPPHIGSRIGDDPTASCPRSSPCRLEHGLAAGAELAVRLPLGEAISLAPRGMPTSRMTLASSAAPLKVPVGLHLVADLVIVLLGVLVLLLLGVVGRLVDVIPPRLGIERRDTLLGELEVVGAVVVALLGLGVGTDRAAPRSAPRRPAGRRARTGPCRC